MRRLLVGVLCVCAIGCHANRQYVEDVMADVDREAFGGKTQAVLVWDWDHQGHVVGHELRVHPAWGWESTWAVTGLVAHCYIHQKLGTPATDHGPMFQVERQRVAQALRVPLGVIPDGRGCSQIEVTRESILMTATMQRWSSRSHATLVAFLPARFYETLPVPHP